MKIELERMREVFSEDGITFAEVSLILPKANDEGKAAERFNKHYGEIARGLIDIGRTLLLTRSRAVYEASSDPRRRFKHRPYCLSLSSALRPDGGDVVISRRLTLSHRGRTLYTETVEERLAPEGAILPQRNKKKKADR